MDLMQLANSLFGRSRSERDGMPSATVELIAAEGAADSADGNAGITLDADITPPDDYDGDESILDVPTSPSVKAGDDVLVALAGSGPLKTPVVLANPGFGDRLQSQMDTTEELVERAEEAARATSQHFWSDDNGAHVTQVTQDEWNDQTSTTTYHRGPNALWNALGMLFRDAENNLLSVLTNGIAIYDGAGNAAENILALITSNLVRIGGRFASSGESSAGVQFFADDSSVSDLRARHYIDTQHDPQVYHDIMLRGETTDAMLTGGTAVHSAKGLLDIYQEVYNDGTNWSEESTTGIRAESSISTHYAYAEVKVLESSAGQLLRYFDVTADKLNLNYGLAPNQQSGTFDTSDVVGALGGTYHLDAVQNVNGSGNTYFAAERTDTGHQIQFGIGADGDNRGIWDESLGTWALYLDANNRLYIPQHAMARHDASTSGSISVPNAKDTSLCSVTVREAGMWLLIGHGFFASNTTGRRVMGITASSGGSLSATATNSVIQQNATDGSSTAISCFDVVTCNYGDSFVRYLTVYQNSGKALSVQGSIKAVRIGMP